MGQRIARLILRPLVRRHENAKTREERARKALADAQANAQRTRQVPVNTSDVHQFKEDIWKRVQAESAFRQALIDESKAVSRLAKGRQRVQTAKKWLGKKTRPR